MDADLEDLAALVMMAGVLIAYAGFWWELHWSNVVAECALYQLQSCSGGTDIVLFSSFGESQLKTIDMAAYFHAAAATRCCTAWWAVPSAC